MCEVDRCIGASTVFVFRFWDFVPCPYRGCAPGSHWERPSPKPSCLPWQISGYTPGFGHAWPRAPKLCSEVSSSRPRVCVKFHPDLFRIARVSTVEWTTMGSVVFRTVFSWYWWRSKEISGTLIYVDDILRAIQTETFSELVFSPCRSGSFHTVLSTAGETKHYQHSNEKRQ